MGKDCWTREKIHETERHIRANDPEFNIQFKYANNYIKTSKYTILTFIPMNLFEQFQRLANFYFLCLLVLQLIPQISSLTPVTTAVPLIVVLSLTALKDAVDDIRRHRSDNQVNNRVLRVLRNGKLVNEKWYKIQVGDIVRMENNQFIPADLLLLSTSEPNGLCYIETAELDGETNLKCRQALTETAELSDSEKNLGAFNGEVKCEPPNNNLNKFEGNLLWKEQMHSLDNDKLLLRGCVLRNTRWCYGVVIFAGRDTKLMQNSGKTIFKRTSLDRLLNWLIIGIVFFLFSMCLFCTIACGVWETVTGRHFRIYLPWEELVPDKTTEGATVISVLVFFSYAIVLNTVVPISLYVSVEIIRYLNSQWINWDQQMYYAPNDTPARAHTTTLNEELGQIEYVFSDKTGTLTQNIMTFNKCSIMGRMYGEVLDEVTKEPLEITENTPSVDFSSNPLYEPSFKFYDKTLLDDVMHGDKDAHEFFLLLSLCHTVMCEEKDGRLEYQAQSPDEAALTSAARNFGFAFRHRTPNSIIVEVMGQIDHYELLAILDFNNYRKRMSVIIRKNGKIKLYCKGADSVIFERLNPDSAEIKLKTVEHLNKFAGEGLRTLCLGVKELDESVYEKWKVKYFEATTSLENRESKVNLVMEEIEKNLTLIGASAIEDKLQDGVPYTIANLALAEIKLWVLTGDKQETAINIGYSCQLLTDDMVDIFIVDGMDFEEVQKQLQTYRENIRSVMSHTKGAPQCSVVTFLDDFFPLSNNREDFGGFALVINGHSLTFALEESMELLFLDVACHCKTVICCRVTPLQKALVVDLIKVHKKAVTLAIGDGANDVSMIKTAHIGIGISGQEGMQAVLASDYSVAQFRFLERLLLVHGRWSYFRMCKFLRYFFYKNFAFTLCHFWFAFFCGFSAQTLFDPAFISVYNVFYTSLPVLALGILDQDVDDKNSIRYSKLYTPGHLNLLFNKVEFLKSVTHGILTSFILFFIPYGAFNNGINSEGRNLDDLQIFGTTVSVILVLAVTSQVALDTTYWSAINHIVIWGSIAFYFILTSIITSNIFVYSYVGTFLIAIATPQFWFTTFLTLTIILVPIVAIRFYNTDVHPTLSDRVRLKQRKSCLRSRPSDTQLHRSSSIRRSSRRSIRSGYAFAHQEGFGRLITSGKIMRKNKSNSFGNNLHPHSRSHNLWVTRPHSGNSREKATPSTVEV